MQFFHGQNGNDLNIVFGISQYGHPSFGIGNNISGDILIQAIDADRASSMVPADGKQRVYLIGLTEKGGLVYDLHTRQSISFDEFPNFESISGIMF